MKSPLLAAALAAALVSCASAPARDASGAAPAMAPAPAASAAKEREVSWEAEVQADFGREVPRFAQKLAKAKIEEMARDKGTYLVDRALYDEAMAQYKR